MKKLLLSITVFIALSGAFSLFSAEEKKTNKSEVPSLEEKSKQAEENYKKFQKKCQEKNKKFLENNKHLLKDENKKPNNEGANSEEDKQCLICKEKSGENGHIHFASTSNNKKIPHHYHHLCLLRWMQYCGNPTYPADRAPINLSMESLRKQCVKEILSKNDLNTMVENIDIFEDYEELIKLLDKAQNNKTPGNCSWDHLMATATHFIWGVIRFDLYSNLKYKKNELFKKTLAILPIKEKLKFLEQVQGAIESHIYVATINKSFAHTLNKLTQQETDRLKIILINTYRMHYSNETFAINFRLSTNLTKLLSPAQIEEDLKKNLCLEAREKLYTCGHKNILTFKEKLVYHYPLACPALMVAGISGFCRYHGSYDNLLIIPTLWIECSKLIDVLPNHSNRHNPFFMLPNKVDLIGLTLQNIALFNKSCQENGGIKKHLETEALLAKKHPLAYFCTMMPIIRNIICSTGRLTITQDINTLQKLEKSESSGFTDWIRGIINSYFHKGNILPAAFWLTARIVPKIGQKYLPQRPNYVEAGIGELTSLLSTTKNLIQDFKNI